MIKNIPIKLNFTRSGLDKWKRENCDVTNYADKITEKTLLFKRMADKHVVLAWEKCIKSADEGLDCRVNRRSPYSNEIEIEIQWRNNFAGDLNNIKFYLDHFSILNNSRYGRDFIRAWDEVKLYGKIESPNIDAYINFSGTTNNNNLISCSMFIPKIEEIKERKSLKMFEKYQKTATYCYGFGDMSSQTAGQICSFMTGGAWNQDEIDSKAVEFGFYWHQRHSDQNTDTIYITPKNCGTGTFHCSPRGLNLDTFCSRFGECGFDVIDRRGSNMGAGDKVLNFKFNQDRKSVIK